MRRSAMIVIGSALAAAAIGATAVWTTARLQPSDRVQPNHVEGIVRLVSSSRNGMVVDIERGRVPEMGELGLRQVSLRLEDAYGGECLGKGKQQQPVELALVHTKPSRGMPGVTMVVGVRCL